MDNFLKKINAFLFYGARPCCDAAEITLKTEFQKMLGIGCELVPYSQPVSNMMAFVEGRRAGSGVDSRRLVRNASIKP
jgi:hypothetical protein